MKEGIIANLQTQKIFFMNTIDCLDEDNSNFKPTDEMYTVAQQIGHTAETFDWFIEGAFGKGFDMNFENYGEKMKKYTSYNECVKQFKAAVEKTIEKFKSCTEAELMEPIKAEIMNGDPKMVIIYSLADHTAHHRGALAVYARLLGKTPKMPYSEM